MTTSTMVVSILVALSVASICHAFIATSSSTPPTAPPTSPIALITSSSKAIMPLIVTHHRTHPALHHRPREATPKTTKTQSPKATDGSVTALFASSASVASSSSSAGNLHGQGSCFLPLLQNDEEYIAPRIVQIAGSYPGVTPSAYLAVTSEPPADLGQWTYDFSDPTGPQLGTVALPGLPSVYECEDPVVVVAEHHSLGVQLPPELVDPVDLVVLCDRSKRYFSERKFLVLELEGGSGGKEELVIKAFGSKEEVPAGAKILGQVMLVQIPWLPSMQKRKSGFMEEDEVW